MKRYIYPLVLFMLCSITINQVLLAKPHRCVPQLWGLAIADGKKAKPELVIPAYRKPGTNQTYVTVAPPHRPAILLPTQPPNGGCRHGEDGNDDQDNSKGDDTSSNSGDNRNDGSSKDANQNSNKGASKGDDETSNAGDNENNSKSSDETGSGADNETDKNED